MHIHMPRKPAFRNVIDRDCFTFLVPWKVFDHAPPFLQVLIFMHSSSPRSPLHGVLDYPHRTRSEFHKCHLVPSIISMFLALSDGSYVVLDPHIVLDAHNVFLCSIFLDSRLSISKTLLKLQQWQSQNCQTFDSLIITKVELYEIVNRSSWILTTLGLAWGRVDVQNHLKRSNQDSLLKQSSPLDPPGTRQGRNRQCRERQLYDHGSKRCTGGADLRSSVEV